MADTVPIPDPVTLADTKTIARNHYEFRKKSNELFDAVLSESHTVTNAKKALESAKETYESALSTLKSSEENVTVESAKATLKSARATLESAEATLKSAIKAHKNAKEELNQCAFRKIYKVVLLTEPVVLGVFPSREDAMRQASAYTNTSIEDCSTHLAHWANPEYIVTFGSFCLRGERQIETMVDPETCIGSGENFVTDFAYLSEKMKVTFKGINYTILSKQLVTFYGEKIIEVGDIIILPEPCECEEQ